MKKNILIIGSNFARTHHLKIIKKLYKKVNIDISSPNIDSKKLDNRISKFRNYEKLLSKKKYNLIICCATLRVQDKFIKYLIKNKIFTKQIILEKPVSKNIKVLRNLLRYLKARNIKLVVNYTYSNLYIVEKIKKIVNDYNKEIKIDFYLKFNHPYFLKRNNSWKNFIKDGGGIINYYLNHIIFSLVDIFNKLEIKKIIINVNTRREYKELYLCLTGKKIKINMFINLLSKRYVHQYLLNLENRNYTFGTTNKNWYKKYYYYNLKNSQKINKKYIHENFMDLITKNYLKVDKKSFFKERKYYYNKIYLTERLCNKINNKLKLYDFKKM